MARLKTVCGIEFKVNDDFVTLFGHLKWCLLNSGYVATVNYDKTKKRAVTQLAHRLAVGHVPRGYVVDHIDSDKLNNDNDNLRIITQSQNCARSRRCGSSGYKGVSWSNQKNKWRSRVVLNGKDIHCGFYTTKKKAAKAYDAKALELFGEFANLNFKE